MESFVFSVLKAAAFWKYLESLEMGYSPCLLGILCLRELGRMLKHGWLEVKMNNLWRKKQLDNMS